MTAAALQARLNAACERHWGEPVVFHAATGTATTCNAVVLSEYDPLDLGGLTAVREQRWTAQINTADLPEQPRVGDLIITAAGARYRVDVDGEDRDGIWYAMLVTDS